MAEERKYAKALGKTIKELRGSRTQKEIAETAGIPISTLSKIEQARQVPRNDTFGKIAHGLGLSVAELEQRVVEMTLGDLGQRGSGKAGPAPGRSGADDVDLAGVPRSAALRIKSTFGTIDALRNHLDNLEHDVLSLVREFQDPRRPT